MQTGVNSFSNLPGVWVDSDEILLSAEENGGLEFRGLYGAVNLHMQLGRGTDMGLEINDPAWMVEYSAWIDDLQLYFDAQTGDLLTGVEESEVSDLPKEFELHPNYPNPFNPTTRFDYDIPIQSDVTIRILDILGREVAVLVSGDHSPGQYHVIWNALDDQDNLV